MAKEIDFELVTTKGGDKGETSNYSEQRIRKDHDTMKMLGDMDELISYLGIVSATAKKEKSLLKYSPDYRKFIKNVQNTLMAINALVATEPDTEMYEQLVNINEKDIANLEKRYNFFLKRTKIEPVFAFPGEKGVETSAGFDFARTLARRCERRIVSVIRGTPPRPDLHDSQRYLNRLSDALFVLARFSETKEKGV